VLPELSSGWEKASLIACPGCYPSSILFPLIPLARGGHLPERGIVINSLSGISGAGKKDSLYYSFAERVESALAYGIGGHRHLSEVEEQLEKASGKALTVQFTPHLVPMLRGIATTMVVPGLSDIDAVYAVWETAYNGRPCIRLLPSGKAPETRHVIGRNRVDISAHADERTGNLIITSVIDNLMKGAGGQAVQIMNLLFGWDESEGLR
jgi:N-acetyl-gamma-glutamyl-phosphate reductase